MYVLRLDIQYVSLQIAYLSSMCARKVAVLESVNRNIDSFQADMERDFDNQIHQLDTILLEMLERADEFLTDNLTITNIPTLAFGGNGNASPVVVLLFAELRY